MIEDEISVRLTPKKPKRTKAVPVVVPDLGGLDDLAALAANWDEEED